MDIRIQDLIDEEKCYETIRKLRWPDGIQCPHCQSKCVIKRGRDDQVQARQRYECKECTRRFDDLSETIWANHRQSIKVWVMFLYFMGLNLSSSQIAKELGLNKDDAQYMAEVLRSGIIERKPEPVLSGKVECDEVYIVAGHKGRAEAVQKKVDKEGGTD